MNTEEIRKSLCFYDPLNPNGHFSLWLDDEDFEIPSKEDCYCDNCFYGKTKLAEYILKLQSGE